MLALSILLNAKRVFHRVFRVYFSRLEESLIDAQASTVENDKWLVPSILKARFYRVPEISRDSLRSTFLRSSASELDRRCAEAFNRNRREMRMAVQKIRQRFRVCFVGFPCTDNAAMSWYWFERGAYNERQPLTVHPLIFSGSRYEVDPRNSESARAREEKWPGGNVGNQQIRHDVKMIMMELINWRGLPAIAAYPLRNEFAAQSPSHKFVNPRIV